MDAQPKTRRVHRERKASRRNCHAGPNRSSSPATRAAVRRPLASTPTALRAVVAEWAEAAPELFPPGFDQGYCLHGLGRKSRKLPGLRLRKIVLADGTSYWLRPGFVTCYMTGTVEELAYPLLLAAHGVPLAADDRLRPQRRCTGIASSSGWGGTVWWGPPSATRPAAAHLAADEHHADWAGQKGYVADHRRRRLRSGRSH